MSIARRLTLRPPGSSPRRDNPRAMQRSIASQMRARPASTPACSRATPSFARFISAIDRPLSRAMRSMADAVSKGWGQGRGPGFGTACAVPRRRCAAVTTKPPSDRIIGLSQERLARPVEGREDQPVRVPRKGWPVVEHDVGVPDRTPTPEGRPSSGASTGAARRADAPPRPCRRRPACSRGGRASPRGRWRGPAPVKASEPCSVARSAAAACRTSLARRRSRKSAAAVIGPMVWDEGGTDPDLEDVEHADEHGSLRPDASAASEDRAALNGRSGRGGTGPGPARQRRARWHGLHPVRPSPVRPRRSRSIRRRHAIADGDEGRHAARHPDGDAPMEDHRCRGAGRPLGCDARSAHRRRGAPCNAAGGEITHDQRCRRVGSRGVDPIGTGRRGWQSAGTSFRASVSWRVGRLRARVRRRTGVMSDALRSSGLRRAA